jgi:signal transduction histidine kinase
MNEIFDLVSRVRHEINNPLTGVLGQAQLLLREELNEKARKRAEVIEQLARRMTDIVADLRLVQRPPRVSGAK